MWEGFIQVRDEGWVSLPEAPFSQCTPPGVPKEGRSRQRPKGDLGSLLRPPNPTQSRAHCAPLKEAALMQKVGLRVGPGLLKTTWCSVRGPSGSGPPKDSLSLGADCAERVLRGRRSLSRRLGGRPGSPHTASPSPGALTTPLCASQPLGLTFPSISGCPPQALQPGIFVPTARVLNKANLSSPVSPSEFLVLPLAAESP